MKSVNGEIVEITSDDVVEMDENKETTNVSNFGPDTTYMTDEIVKVQDKKKRFFVDWNKKQKIAFIVSLIIVLGLVFSFGLYMFMKDDSKVENNYKEEVADKRNKVKATELGDNYAKYDIELYKSLYLELENGLKIDLIDIKEQNYNEYYMLKFDNKTFNVAYDTQLTIYTIGSYIVVDSNTEHFFIDKDGLRNDFPSSGKLTGITLEDGLAYQGLKVLDDGIYVSYSRLLNNSDYIYDIGNDSKVNICDYSSTYMEKNITHSFDYYMEFDKEKDTLVSSSEMKNVVTFGEFRNNFDLSLCSSTITYYAYKEWYRDGGEVYYSLSDKLPNDRYEEIDHYNCKSNNCVMTSYLDYNVANGYYIYYIYDGGQFIMYDMEHKDGFKKVYLTKKDIIDINKYDISITEYDDKNARLFLGYDKVKKEYILRDMYYGEVYMEFQYRPSSITLCEDTLDNYVTITLGSLGLASDTPYTVVYDFNKQKEVIKLDLSYGKLNKKDDYYLFNYAFTGPSFSYIYDKDFNLILEDVVNYNYTIYNNKLYVADGAKKDGDNYTNNTYYKVYEGKEIKTSSTYDNILHLENKYGLVYKDDRVKLIDLDSEEVVADFSSVSEVGYYHNMLSGEWKKDNKKGLYFIFNSKNTDCSKVDKEILINHYDGNYDSALKACNDDYYESSDGYYGSLGVEYYYIYDTKEVGSFYTIVGEYAKPILYLYPENDNTNITVKFKNPNVLTTTYPKYINSWNVIANRNGDLIDKNGRSYYGLYWEETGSINVDFSEGFYVTKDNAIDFLEDSLARLGFTEREANEFIMYWLPILEKNGKSLVYFELTESREGYNGLDISPKPDSMLRVAIHIKKVDKKTNIRKQYLPTFTRSGFTVVEWGGVIH